MTPHKYILDANGNPVIEPSLFTWAAWIETHDCERVVGKTIVGGVEISTVFLGLDHNFEETGPPILWETMIFGGPPDLDRDQRRCAGSREQAEAQHMRVVAMVEAALGIKTTT